MVKRLLKRIIFQYLDQAFPENLNPSKKKTKRVRNLLDAGKSTSFLLSRVKKSLISIKDKQSNTPFFPRQKKQVQNLDLFKTNGKQPLPVETISKIEQNYPFSKLSLVCNSTDPLFLSHRSFSVTKKVKTKKNLFSLTNKKSIHSLYSLDQLQAILKAKENQQRRTSTFKLQLQERKKLSILYGNLSKKEVKQFLKKGFSFHGNFNDNLFQLLEGRIDVILYRIGFFQSIQFARQWINHGRILINQKMVTTPNYQVQPGDFISVSDFNKNKNSSILIENSLLKTIKTKKILSYPLQYHENKFPFFLIKKNLIDPLFLFSHLPKQQEMQLFFNILSQFHQKMKESGLSSPASKSVKVISSNTSYTDKHHFLFSRNHLISTRLKRLLTLKKTGQLKKNILFYFFLWSILKIKPFFGKKNTKIGVKFFTYKPLHVEVSYKTFTAIYLYTPQKIVLPVSIDIEGVKKSYL